MSFLFGLVFASCSESSVENKYANWRERNEAFIDSIATVFEQKKDPDLFRYEDQRNIGNYIYYKVLESGDQSSDLPYLTSTVNVFYRGMLIDLLGSPVINLLKEPRYITKAYKKLPVFDKNFTEDDPNFETNQPTAYVVGNLVSGWIEILQHMHEGDRWELYIPYRSGYGSTPNGAIPAYSTLIFDLTRLDIVKP